MSDPWVFNTQVWLNNTYSGVSGWTPIPATGKTGWPTMYALIRALQHELGIVVLSDNFGPGTLAALDALGNIGPSTVNKNIVRILQGGIYGRSQGHYAKFAFGYEVDTTVMVHVKCRVW